LTIKNVDESLLICGQVGGPAHITGVEHSIIVVSCQQFRMHNCKNVDVYLSCSSNPIIEDCSNVRFGRIPKAYVSTLSSRLLLLSANTSFRLSTMTAPTTRIAGARSKISNGSSLSPVPIGVFWIPAMQFPRRSGRRSFPAGRVGHSMIFCMLFSWFRDRRSSIFPAIQSVFSLVMESNLTKWSYLTVK
jgi:hypothetical protein